MKLRRILGVIVLILGIGLLSMSLYITSEVEKGQGQVGSAQKNVDKGNDLFSRNPVTKEVGKGLTKPIQKKIDEGKEEILKYTQYALWMKIGGICFMIVGAGMIVLGKKK